MLLPAFFHAQSLNEVYSKIIHQEQYRFYVENIWNYEIEVDSTDEHRLQLISFDGKTGSVIGYLSAELDRNHNTVTALEAISFEIGLNSVFSIDFHRFIKNLTTKYGFRKVSFEVICGSPFEKLYNKHLERYNGRVVGIKKQEVKLSDGNLYDVKLYELFPNSDFNFY